MLHCATLCYMGKTVHVTVRLPADLMAEVVLQSKAQQRMKFYLSEHGKMSMKDAIGSAKASHYDKLPSHVKHKKRSGR